LTPLAWWSMWKAEQRALVLLCIGIFLAYWTINSGAVNWRGGDSTGPRYMTPSLPFLSLPFAWFWEQSGSGMRRLLIVMAVISIVACFAMASIDVTAPAYGNVNIVLEILLPELAKGNFKNLILSQTGISPFLAFVFYAILVGGGLLSLWLATPNDQCRPYHDLETAR
jgi:hypothetical protein